MRKLICLIITIALTLSFTACAFEKRGNTNGNIAQIGYAALNGGFVYYNSFAKDGGIFKVPYDCASESVASKRVKISEDNGLYINALGDRVYYCETETGNIYSISTDGEDKTRLSEEDCSYMLVVGDYIYYLVDSDYEMFLEVMYYKSLYKMRLDGSENERLINGEVSMYFCVADDGYIYYDKMGKSKDMESGEYRVKTNGLERELIFPYYMMGCVIEGDKIYAQLHSSDDVETGVFQMDLDGSNRTLIRSGTCLSLNVSGDWVYYIGEGMKLFRVKKDGSQETVISEDRCGSVNIIGDYIYYTDMTEAFDTGFNGAEEFEQLMKLYRTRLDGSEKTLMG